MEDSNTEWQKSDQRCGIDNCRSKRYRRADDGLIYCSYGHQTAAPPEIADDDENNYARPSQRTTKLKPEKTVHEKTSRFLAGREAAEEYLQCYQSILAKQVRWLIDEKGYPPELEVVVQDLWTLRVQMLEPLVRKAANERDESQLYSSQTSQKDSQEAPAPLAKTLPRALTLDECLAMLYLASMLLRLPTTIRDLLDWIANKSFPYLTASSHLPTQATRRIPIIYLHTFRPRTGMPDPGQLHSSIIDLAKLHARSSTPISWPTLNHAPLLFRIISEAALPLEVFPAVTKLGSSLGIAFDFSLNQGKGDIFSLPDYPELQLIALIIVAVKLFYPFDSIIRHPKHASEPAALVVDWRAWAKVHAKHPAFATKSNHKDSDSDNNEEDDDNASNASNADDEKNNEKLWSTKEADVLSMTPQETDVYLSWFRRTWLTADTDADDTGRDYDFQRDLNSLFPLEYASKDNTSERSRDRDLAETNTTSGRLKRAQASIGYRAPVPDSTNAYGSAKTPDRPGSRYKQYRKVADLPDNAKPFYYLMAYVAAIEVEALVRAVFRMEQRVGKWVREEDKKASGAVDTQDDEDDDDDDDDKMIDN